MVDLAEGISWGIVIVGLFVGFVFLFAIAGAFVGLVTGWIVHISPLRSIVEDGFEAIGINADGQLANIGAVLGFITGFLRSSVKVNKEKD